jgi:hemerythrin|tara:strand:- start:99 stop:497 length:399 start_codon:yes stop_codon:yes gene_type:complete
MKTFMNKNIDIELFVIIIVSFLVGFYAKNYFFKNGQNGSQYNKIHNKLDSEHEDILNACDNLYNVCEKHWNTEEKYYEKGIQNMPPAHKNIAGEWQVHRQEHINTLNGIKQMKNNIINHINQKDTRHFHWLS